MKVLKKISLLLGVFIFIFNLFSLTINADTMDIDTHFGVEVIETEDSKTDAEEIKVTIKNISKQSSINTVVKIELPESFAKKLGKSAITKHIGTLKANNSKYFTVKLSDGSISPLTIISTNELPITGETIINGVLVLGLLLLIVSGIIFCSRRILGLFVVMIALTGAVVVSATSYNHMAIHNHQVKIAGQTSPFTTVVTGDFEEEASSSSTDNSSSSSTDTSSSTNNSSSSSQSSTSSSDSDNPETPEEPVTSEVTKYTVSFDLNGGDSEAISSQDVEENGLVKKPSDPTKSGHIFKGWYEKESGDFKLNHFNFLQPITANMILYAKWEMKKYSVSYDFNGGVLHNNAILPSDKNQYLENEMVTVQNFDNNLLGANPLVDSMTKKYVTKFGYHFKGWNTQADGNGNSISFNSSFKMVDTNIVLYAEWTRDEGDHICFNTADEEGWRVLKESTNHQFLVLKVHPLLDDEIIDAGRSDHWYSTGYNDVPFHKDFDGYFKNGTTSTGYGESNLKYVIDNYYVNYIEAEYSDYVLPVKLNLPTYSEFIGSGFNGIANGYNDWHWNYDMEATDNFWQDTRFKTTISSDVADKKAFALSMGDIWTLNKQTFFDSLTYYAPYFFYWDIQSDTGSVSTLLLFHRGIEYALSDYSYFWLRSTGMNNDISYILRGCFAYTVSGRYDTRPVRPALWLTLEN
ncbi:MAG: InlB B-repeat-containing protein [Streptococcaceae bacterium]|jgi:uncharacterized repeat protein (TIGR02543 family)/LPXTG-motif cell wall-anchored protein|nr:InlB B-repeat-containing protein [Streptococcaceae bacterium]MCH4177880.1 InlB B-repeat-containing protein [Streptococcaceae bacterium]